VQITSNRCNLYCLLQIIHYRVVVAGFLLTTLSLDALIEWMSSLLSVKNKCSLTKGMIFGLNAGVMGGLIYWISQGFKGPKVETTFFPNQGIWQSAKSAVFLGLMGGITGGLISSLMIGIGGFLKAIPLEDGSILKTIILGRGLSYGLVNGTVLGVVFGGIGACVKHLTLRLMLHQKNFIPWDYARFLDYASDRLFLQKVGGGYIFIHRILLEHFAQMKRTM
jgi:hypothetical protein